MSCTVQVRVAKRTTGVVASSAETSFEDSSRSVFLVLWLASFIPSLTISCLCPVDFLRRCAAKSRAIGKCPFHHSCLASTNRRTSKRFFLVKNHHVALEPTHSNIFPTVIRDGNPCLGKATHFDDWNCWHFLSLRNLNFGSLNSTYLMNIYSVYMYCMFQPVRIKGQVRIHDQVRSPASFGKGKVLLWHDEAHNSLLSMARCKFVTLGCCNGMQKFIRMWQIYIDLPCPFLLSIDSTLFPDTKPVTYIR